MTSASEAKKTSAIRDSVMELIDPSAPGNRVERSILETLYTSLSAEERSTLLGDMIKQGYDRKETAERIEGLEETYFGITTKFNI